MLKLITLQKKLGHWRRHHFEIPRPSEQKKIQHTMYTSPQIRTKKKKEIHLLLFKKHNLILNVLLGFKS